MVSSKSLTSNKQPALGGGEDTEVRHVGVPAQLDVAARGRRAGQVGRHEARRPAQEGEGGLEHPAPAHGHESGDPRGVLGVEQRDGIGAVGRRLPPAVAGAGYHRAATAAGATLPVPAVLSHRRRPPHPCGSAKTLPGAAPRGNGARITLLSLAGPRSWSGGVEARAQAAPSSALSWRRTASTLSSMRTFLPTTTPPVSRVWL